MACEVTISGTPGETVVVGLAELASAPGLVAVEGAVSDSLWEKFKVVLDTGVFLSEEWPQEAVVSGSPGETVTIGAAELASLPGWVTLVAAVSGSCGDSVRVETTVLISASGLVTSEVAIARAPGETAVVRTAELTSAPGLVAVGDVVCDSLRETVSVAMETVGLVSAGWVAHEVVVSSSPKVTVGMATADLVSAPELETGEGMVSDPLLKTDEAVQGTAVLASAPGLGANEAVLSGMSVGTSGVVVVAPAVPVLTTSPDVLRRAGIPKVGEDTWEAGVTVEGVSRAVAVASALSVASVGSPGNRRVDTQFAQSDYHLLDWQ